MTYCIICYEHCRKPVSCVQCHQILCSEHVKHLRSRCPNCRSEPFQLRREYQLDSIIKEEILEQRKKDKLIKIFNCLQEDCEFIGNFEEMIEHQKQNHPNLTIQEILYQDERQAKFEIKVLQELIKIKLNKLTNRHNQMAFFIYLRSLGQCNLYTLLKMVQHLDKCQNPSCKKIFVEQDRVFIGDPDRIPTQCDRAKLISD